MSISGNPMHDGGVLEEDQVDHHSISKHLAVVIEPNVFG